MQLIWQPIYLCVLGMHLIGQLPRLAWLGQSAQNGIICGYRLLPSRATAILSARSVERAARQLRAYLNRQFRESAQVFRVPVKMADRLAADYLMAALLRVQRQLDLSNDEMHALETRWLQAMGMQGCSSLIDISLTSGCSRLALGRKVCCQHFRRADGNLCNSCPRHEPEMRMFLLRQELTTGY